MRRALLLLSILLAFACMAWQHPGSAPAMASPASSPIERVPVYYVGSEGVVKDALHASPLLQVVASPSQARSIVVNDAALTPDQASELRQATMQGAGLVLILGPRLSAAPVTLLLGAAVIPTPADDAASIVAIPDGDPIIARNVIWNSAPQVRERSAVTLQATPLASVYGTGEAILLQVGGPPRPTYILTVWLGRSDNGLSYNPQMAEWAYFGYLIYHLAARSAGAVAVPFADYALSPVPHQAQRIAIVMLVALMITTTLGAFATVRRYSLRHPELLDRLIGHVDAYRRNAQAGATNWEEVGFQRPLAGFIVFLSVALIMFIPLMVYQVIIVPRVLVPSVQTYGAWNWVVNWFQLFWMLFDMGTSVALVKYLSQMRVDRPQEGIKYAQVFVWWQAITGTIQLGAVALLSAYVLPQTSLGYLAYYFIVHALIQFPGFLRVYQYTMRALQRTDADQTLNILASPAPQMLGILVIVVQSAAVLLLRGVLGSSPAIGGAMGSALAMGLGLYLTEISFFLVSMMVYRRLGFGARLVFMAHFDVQTVKSALSFGFPVMIGGIFGALGWFVQGTLIQRYLVNYTEVYANWTNAWQLIIAYSALGSLYDACMPAVSEAFSHGRLHLVRYYITQGFKYGGWLSAWVLGAFLAIGDRFILGALGQQWVRAAQLVGVLMVWGAMQFPAWLADKVQQGSGKPQLNALFLIIEQSLRIVLMFAFVQRFQLMGLLAAYMIALPTKNVLAWITNWKLIVRFRIHWWQTVVAPLLAGAIVYVTVRTLGDLIWTPNLTGSLVLFLIGTLPTLPYYCFWNGLFGGWDAGGLDELRLASEMTPFRAASAAIARSLGRLPGLGGRRAQAALLAVCAWLFNPGYLMYRSTAIGARLSPLHDRFPIPAQAATSEARSLTLEKVALK